MSTAAYILFTASGAFIGGGLVSKSLNASIAGLAAAVLFVGIHLGARP